MTTPLPSYVHTGLVKGKQGEISSDTAGDVDTAPDAAWAVGATLKFSPSITYLLFTPQSGIPDGATWYLFVITATVNASGDPVTAAGDPLYLPANLAQPLNDQDWYWSCQPTVNGTRLEPFRFDVTADATNYLANQQPIPATTTASAVVRGPAGPRGSYTSATRIDLADLNVSSAQSASFNGGAIAEALTELAGSGTMVLPFSADPILFTGHLIFDGVDLLGAGGSDGVSATILQATAAGDRIEFAGGGSRTAGFRIDGNNIATLPFARTGGTGANGRLFESVSVFNSAQDIAYFESAQNDLFLQCGFRYATRDLAWFDGGFGGAAFYRCEFAGAGRYHHRFDVTVDHTAFGDYPFPSDIAFRDCILEGNAGVSLIKIVQASNMIYDGTDFFSQNQIATPFVDIGAAGSVNLAFGNCLFQNGGTVGAYATGSIGIKVDGPSLVHLFGHLTLFGFETWVEPVSIVSIVDDKAASYHVGVGNKWAPGGSANGYSKAAFFDNGVAFDQQYDWPVVTSYAYQRTALLARMDRDGSLHYYPGGTFIEDASFGRRSAGVVGTPGGTQQLVATGAGTTGQRPDLTGKPAGALYANSTTGTLEFWNGSAWVDCASGGGGSIDGGTL